MKWRRRIPTYAVVTLALVVTAILGVDLVLALNDKPDDTYSEVFALAAREWPILYVFFGLFWGVLLGHWFWPVYRKDELDAALE
jgi:ABC-type uncharacterized transport system permease subunit